MERCVSLKEPRIQMKRLNITAPPQKLQDDMITW